jgi:hypothetical protein
MSNHNHKELTTAEQIERTKKTIANFEGARKILVDKGLGNSIVMQETINMIADLKHKLIKLELTPHD